MANADSKNGEGMNIFKILVWYWYSGTGTETTRKKKTKVGDIKMEFRKTWLLLIGLIWF
jgi:hypothetical protein